ncbi:hypothetical protein C0J50_12114 [Silurus asotus]|uniref:Uncharacterized protein n=1 Tax=Silurus asotus TaxID=30991 RepID=A0AAD5FBM9_SILAS|nr:hypothetical protein C0J50_12114 [Silurus asotus]
MVNCSLLSRVPGDSERSNLEDRVMELEELLSETHRVCMINTQEWEQYQDVYCTMKVKYDGMKESVKHL